MPLGINTMPYSVVPSTVSARDAFNFPLIVESYGDESGLGIIIAFDRGRVQF
jgi:hypothetical protein